MRRTSHMATIAAMGLLILAAAPASAAVVTYTYTGTFREGLDSSGVFGPALRNLAGVGFTAVFARDDATPGATFVDDGVQTQIFGYMAPAPVWGEITVDGVTWAIRDDFGAQTQTEEADFCGLGCDREAFNHFVAGQLEANSPDGSLYLYDRSFVDLTGFGFGTDVLPNRDYHSLPDVQRSNQFAMVGEMRIAATVIQVDGGVLLSDASAWGYLAPTSVTVTSSAAVPEPGVWALMVGGFGLAGAALRRARVAERA